MYISANENLNRSSHTEAKVSFSTHYFIHLIHHLSLFFWNRYVPSPGLQCERFIFHTGLLASLDYDFSITLICVSEPHWVLAGAGMSQ